MNKFNKVLNTIIIALMIGATITLVALVIIDGTGHHMISILSYYLLIMIAGTIALLLTPEVDLYDGYIPEPDRSEEYEQIQRYLYEKEYDMSEDIEYDDFEPSGFDYCDHCDYGDDDETEFVL